MQPKTYIQTPQGTVDASSVTVPASREFRDAWDLNGPVIEVNMSRAIVIHKDAIRRERDGRFEPFDKVVTPLSRRVARGGNLTPAEEAAFDAAEAVAQKLRDAPADIRIENATTPEELSALTLDALIA
jgi:hypothetical protein